MDRKGTERGLLIRVGILAPRHYSQFKAQCYVSGLTAPSLEFEVGVIARNKTFRLLSFGKSAVKV